MFREEGNNTQGLFANYLLTASSS